MASRIARTLPLTAFVLHRYDWSESSLILDLFTREQGRHRGRRQGRQAAVLAAARRAAAVPAHRTSRSAATPRARSGAEVQNLRGADWAGGAGDAHRRRALQRLLPQRAADEAARPARPAPGAVRRLRRDPRRPRRRRRGARPVGAARVRDRAAARRSACCPTSASRPRPAGRCGRRSATACSPTPASSPRRARPTPPPAAPRWPTVQAALAGGDIAALQRVAARALAELQALAAGPASYHLGTDSLRTRRSCSRHKP